MLVRVKNLNKWLVFFFFFKQKTAYEIRKGDWSSDVCSSDLQRHHFGQRAGRPGEDGDLIGHPSTTLEECADGISSEEDVAQRRGVSRGPLGVSSTDHPSFWSSSRSSSERRQSRRLRASERSLTRRSTSAGGPATVTPLANRPSAPPRRLTSSTPATSACWASASSVRSTFSYSARARSNRAPSA